jgi:hypothetical protein
MDRLPAYVVAEVARGDTRLREDLRLISYAESTGWRVAFRNDSWHNAAHFTKGVWCVWYAPNFAASGWRSACSNNGRYQNHMPHKTLLAALEYVSALPDTSVPPPP